MQTEPGGTLIACCMAWILLANFSSGAVLQNAQRQEATHQDNRPNIIFIFSDDHAVQAIGAYGSRLNQTPRIDELARTGMTFDRCFCGNSICGPSRATVLTGRHSHLNGFMRNGDRFFDAQPTFPKLLQNHGYQTAVIGKWHLVSDPVGFDYWEVLPDQGHYYNPDFIQMDGTRRRFEGYCTDLIGDKSIEWLERRDPRRPFLLMCQHKAPHRNWSPHPRHFGRYPLGTIPEPETLFDDLSNRSPLLGTAEMSIARHFYWGHDAKFPGENEFPDYFLSGLANGEYQRMNEQQRAAWDAYYGPENDTFLRQLRQGELTPREITAWKYQRYLHDYLGSVAAVDDNVGKILDYLDTNGLSENTIVIYSSDQGFYLGEHGWYDKRWMFEESLRMPLIVRWPGRVAAASRSAALVQNIDFAPTLLACAGVEPPPEMQGRNLVPVLREAGRAPDDWREEIYYAFYENEGAHRVPQHDGIRTDRYKLMFFPSTKEWQLFDLQNDPQELRSVHAEADYQVVLAELQSRYHKVRQQYCAHSAVIPESRWGEAWWRERYDAKLREAREKTADIVLIGDSITQGWERTGRAAFDKTFSEDSTLNLGFSGDRTEHVLWRLKRGCLAKQQPRVFVIMIGTNNTGHLGQDPDEVADGIREIVNTLRGAAPAAKILLLGVFPRGERADDPGRINNRLIDERIAALGDSEHIVFADLTSLFVGADGKIAAEIMPDFLHLSPRGYQMWADALQTLLKPLLAR